MQHRVGQRAVAAAAAAALGGVALVTALVIGRGVDAPLLASEVDRAPRRSPAAAPAGAWPLERTAAPDAAPADDLRFVGGAPTRGGGAPAPRAAPSVSASARAAPFFAASFAASFARLASARSASMARDASAGSAYETKAFPAQTPRERWRAAAVSASCSAYRAGSDWSSFSSRALRTPRSEMPWREPPSPPATS